MKSKLFTTKKFTITITAHDSLHKMLRAYLDRFLQTEGRRIENGKVEVETV